MNELLNQRINEDEETFAQLNILNEEKEKKINLTQMEVKQKEKELAKAHEILEDFDKKIQTLLEENERMNEIV